MMPQVSDYIGQIRSFNRFYTNIIGLLDQHILESPYSLSEVRILFEINRMGTCTARQIKESVKMDEGYLSRIVEKFVDGGLIKKRKSTNDARVYNLTLTAKGKNIFNDLDSASDCEVKNLIEGISRKGLRSLTRNMEDIMIILSGKCPSARNRKLVL